ncbi:MAG: hypothetical protein PHV63_01520, partial [Candidatus Daviesbacteria bacterium]|nr:hypothetical protein [Candidatus Daviesbacteria bacterium]
NLTVITTSTDSIKPYTTKLLLNMLQHYYRKEDNRSLSRVPVHSIDKPQSRRLNLTLASVEEARIFSSYAFLKGGKL